jgi:RNA methyltransferase, TrmH family
MAEGSMITSTDNQRIKAARKLNQRRQRETSGQLLLEGVRLISDALYSGIQPEIVFYAPDLSAENQAATALLHQLQQRGVDCIACTAEVFATLTETVTPQGLVAVVPLPQLPLSLPATFTLILDQVRDPGNAGTLLRTAEAAGVAFAIFAPGTVDPFNDKVLRAGMGAHFHLPIRTCPRWEEVQELLGCDQQLYLADAHATLTYDQVEWRAPVALIVGGEAEGASPVARSLAHPIAIPMHGNVESLNAAVAGAVILFEAARQRRAAPLGASK